MKFRQVYTMCSMVHVNLLLLSTGPQPLFVVQGIPAVSLMYIMWSPVAFVTFIYLA